MLEQKGDLWDYHTKGEIIVITTNGFIRKDNQAAMGAGCALEAKLKYPFLPGVLGEKLLMYGNQVHNLGMNIYTYPTKHNWWDKSDMKLIVESAEQLASEIKFAKDEFLYDEDAKVYLPRPGCGNGGLKWENVKPEIENILDDNFIALHR